MIKHSILEKGPPSFPKRNAFSVLIKEWEYCYCQTCDKIRYSFELEAMNTGIRCTQCGNSDLEAPAWIFCPHMISLAATKCPRAGKGIRKGKSGIECIYRCAYRMK